MIEDLHDAADPSEDPPVGADPLLWHLAYLIRDSHRPRVDGFCGCKQWWPCEATDLANECLRIAAGQRTGHPGAGSHLRENLATACDVQKYHYQGGTVAATQPETSDFSAQFRNAQRQAHDNAARHGFNDYTKDMREDSFPFAVATKLALIHSEVSEALAEVRLPNRAIRGAHATEFGGELADIVLRAMDLAEMCDIDLGKAIEEKFATYGNRPFRHGGKRF